MSDLRSKVQKRVQPAAAAKPVADVLKSERSDVKRTTLYLSTDDVRALKQLALDEDTTMTALVNEGIAWVLQSRSK
ncbi:Antitoxin-like ribbon-helix-helix domain-containing protein OS=Tsukamurella paurometabola (strain ATCC 8368 / DSM / CCUG 35730 / CIP 100753 / JCM 10117/ KCTC 9821 / NBRC 16120 / NCIMB 702349 / NCTC 13040) OX=521096 GN=Tpau_4262 PE=4 SV=1 [Tsukamurella paurometabola]|uniref:Antitoxin-like ribbon-helix-helix domain-containing protein n=1 Tax=Tsukamurella paurometabola (strain ATCC 8368 / DSM 20162 / CCUG 35730 / CIP 100753 / JCM 10117 / KCTC 9821 / NBRC 16120 / NCIMB 702349 / NCTC 13040) TaxID=521096 RepID=D5UYY1_TSUPD|nr:ribbon-helix-helix domain-containing protein [Tsukamurella paurometabola]ADG80828.1 hypothetical protein Tpau_4262 [Tsukamurella paurometabola DSM 20162]SUQ39187.1 Uncharacterised protein [Tsukamurella paurometabola]